MTNDASGSPNLSRRLTDLLDFEIQRIQTENAQPGWTVWALLGALATSAWLALAELESQRADTFKTLLVALALHLTYDLLVLGSALLSASNASRDKRVRFRLSHHILSHGRVYLAVNSARYTGLLSIAMLNSLVPTGWLTVCVYAVLGSLLLLNLFALMLSFAGIPVPEPPRGTPIGTRVTVVAAFAVLVIAVGHLSRILFVILTAGDIVSMRLGALIAVFAVLASFLARERSHPPLLRTLIDVRRGLALDDLDYETARKQTEIALKGMTVFDMYQVQAEQILENLRKVATAAKSIRSRVRTLRPTLTTKDASQYGGEEVTNEKAIRDSVFADLKQAEEALDAAAQEMYALHRRVQWQSLFAPHASSDLGKFMCELNISIGEVQKEVEELSSDIQDDIAQLQSLGTHEAVELEEQSRLTNKE